MRYLILSIFRDATESTQCRSSQRTCNSSTKIDSRPSSPVDIPRPSSRHMIPDSTPLCSPESEISPTTIPRLRRGAIYPVADRRRFRSSIYSQRALDPSAISLPAPSSIYSQLTNRNAAPSVAHSRRSRGEGLSERDVPASQISLFGDYSIAPKPTSKRARFLGAIKQRLAAFRHKMFPFGRRREKRSRVRRFLDGQSEAAGLMAQDGDEDDEDDDDDITQYCIALDDDNDDMPFPRFGMDIPPDSYEVQVAEANLAAEERAAAEAATVDSDERRESCGTSSYVSVFEEEREREMERVRNTEVFLFEGWNEFGKWNDQSFFMWR